MHRSLLPILILVLLPLGCHSDGKRLAGVDNFAVVEQDVLYRGAQPSAEGVKTLKSRGVKTIINLRDDPNSDEHSNAKVAGMTYILIPTNAGRIEPEKINAFLTAVQSADGPVFVHCAVGCDRTGLEIAMFRIVVQKWPRE